VKKFSLLEELDISFKNLSKTSIEVIGLSCPLLKSLNLDRSKSNFYYNALSVLGNRRMPRLRHLLFSGLELGHDGLLAVLDGCPLLESLDLRKCIIPRLSQNLERRCRQKITDLKFPKYFFDDDLDVDDAYVLMNFQGLDN